MTRPAREPTPFDSTTPRSVIAARLAIPIALAVVGYAVLVAEQWSVDHELQLVAPEQIRAGDPIPLRAMVFRDIEHPDGDGLEEARVEPVEPDLEVVVALGRRGTTGGCQCVVFFLQAAHLGLQVDDALPKLSRLPRLARVDPADVSDKCLGHFLPSTWSLVVLPVAARKRVTYVDPSGG